ncbi:ABC transporter ATP-binding protein [Rhizobium leguminosarum]|uniref:ABC transporter ATP-binding protein n=1 Tax=Rhizobium leguminosarum TaxID=384 RepID=UPI001C97C093|nr:ABC transporter ATP-binding protein [Rhizobium leguminosarum]MBY5760264.1 ABC transporter ATP-binding protein [Rhizobium leguminosarum]
MASLTVSNVSKVFPNGMRVLDDISVDIRSGEFLTLLGPSGCGKTTLLKAIAGFHSISSGRILIDGADVTDLPPERRDTAMCFQSYALFPHMTVAENILFGPKQNGVPKDERSARLQNALRQVDLDAHATKLPAALSGGQQQRVALARAMAMRPGIILFDEPLSNLDAKLREQVRFEMRALQAEHGYTAVYVTHDQAEALAMSDRIVVMRAGRIEQIGAPADIYHNPKNRFVADFIGAANVMKAHVVERMANGHWLVSTDLGRFEVASDSEPAASSLYICWRPEDAEIVRQKTNPPTNDFSASVAAQAFLGNVTDIIVRSAPNDAEYRVQTRLPQTVGAPLTLHIDPDRFTFLEAVR